jgi:NDP-sugar pyrophosphorylase family protein
MRAVILAGGRGTRLAPYTTVLPKPLMPIGEHPVLELLIRRLARSEIDRVTIAVGHLASLIQAYFGDGSHFGVRIDYSAETEPLGTAGPLSLISGIDERFLVMNGDLLTDLDFGLLLSAHSDARATATVGLYERDVPIDLGVIETDDSDRIVRYIEKPVYHYRVSMGAYVFEPEVISHIPKRQAFDLPDLIHSLIAAGKKVVGYPHTGYWLDIGRPDDYQRAQEDFNRFHDRLGK